MGRKEPYSDRLKREGGMVASGKFRERREATCECCRRNDAPEGERLCVSCARHHDALVQKRNEYAERLQYVRDARAETEIERQRLTEELASVNADRHRLEILYEEARREQHRWEDIAAERGVRMDEIQARAEAAEAALAEARRALEDGVRIASQYLDTGRGDLDGWIDQARALAEAGGGTGQEQQP